MRKSENQESKIQQHGNYSYVFMVEYVPVIQQHCPLNPQFYTCVTWVMMRLWYFDYFLS